MNRIERFSEFDKANESAILLPAALIWLLVRTMKEDDDYYSRLKSLRQDRLKSLRDDRTPDQKREDEASARKAEVDRQYTSGAQEDIDVPWWKIGKLKKDFLEMEKNIRPLVSSEKQRLSRETFEYDVNSIVFDFWNDKRISEAQKKEVEALMSRISQKYIQTPKKEKLIGRVVAIYMSEISKRYADTFEKYEADTIGSSAGRFSWIEGIDHYMNDTSISYFLKKEVVKRIGDLVRGYSSDLRDKSPIGIEKFKPVKPVPIDPEVLKRIEEYEAKKKEIDDDIAAQKEREAQGKRKEKEEEERKIREPKERDVKKVNDLVEAWFQSGGARVESENAQDFAALRKRISASEGQKAFELSYRIFVKYWAAMEFHYNGNKIECGGKPAELESLRGFEASKLAVGSLFCKIGLDKIVYPNVSDEKRAEILQRFIRFFDSRNNK